MTAQPTVAVARGLDVQVRNVVHLYSLPEGDVVALRGVDLDVDSGEILALLGPSGAGKSTLLAVLAGLVRPSAGEVRVGGHLLGRMPPRQLEALRASEIAFVPQDPQRGLLPYASGVQNVAFAMRGARGRGLRPPWSAEELLALLGLDEVGATPVSVLPGGLQKQVALAAGLATNPRLLLVDEPTSQLDELGREEVIGALFRVAELSGATVVLVTHDPAVGARLPRTVTIRDGRIGAEGRHGTDYSVVGADGSLHLPPDILETLPPGTLVRVTTDDEVVYLRPAGQAASPAEPEPPTARRPTEPR
jgi:putative ABC transport system ATP-binding protein